MVGVGLAWWCRWGWKCRREATGRSGDGEYLAWMAHAVMWREDEELARGRVFENEKRPSNGEDMIRCGVI